MNKDANIRLQDNVVLEHYGLNELHLESVRHYREQFAKAKPNHPWNGLETKDFLYKIGGMGKNTRYKQRRPHTRRASYV
ncbi:MAG: hypothetical protein KatS3mg080_0937 [Anoxybacillus sp.]|nr:MAG: hypothetical protein KatS3mg080_0937 [Anoxybacillus sp.]